MEIKLSVIPNYIGSAMVATFMFCVLFSPSVIAQSATPANTSTPSATRQADMPSEIRNVETREVKGQIIKVEGNRATLQSNNETMEIAIPESIAITRNAQNADRNDLKPGDQITLIQTPQGDVLSIEATEEGFIDWKTLTLPLIIGGLLLAGLLYSLLKGANRSHIKTTTQ